MYHKPRSIVSSEFRVGMAGLLPGLKENPSFWEFIGLLTWGYNEGNGVIIGQQTLARIERKLDKLNYGRYVAQAFLDKFSSEVMHIEYSDWNFDQYRTITYVAWPLGALELIEKESNRMFTGKRVYLSTGMEYTAKNQSVERENDKQYALAQMALASNKEAQTLLAYLNNLPHNRFKVVLSHMEEVYEKVALIENEHTRREQIANLRAIQDQYQVVYVPKNKTVRIFSLNMGLTTVRKDLRKILTQDWLEMDLQNSQLAIAAKYWDIPEVEAFLKTGKSLWSELFTYFGLEPNDEIKTNIFKKAVYGLMYGMAKTTLVDGNDKFKGLNTLLAEYSIVDGGTLFLAHPLIKAVLRQRNKMMKQIEQDRGAVNIYNEWIPITQKQNVRSVLAQLMQAVELHLLYPIVELAKSTDQFQILLWQHDGCSIHFTDKRRKDLWIARIIESVQQKIDSLGIITRLVY